MEVASFRGKPFWCAPLLLQISHKTAFIEGHFILWSSSAENSVGLLHRDCSIHIERECLVLSIFAKLGYFVRQICFLLFLYYSDLLYKSMPGLCLIISRAARYLPKPALNNIPSLLCILRSLWLKQRKEIFYLTAAENCGIRRPLHLVWMSLTKRFVHKLFENFGAGFGAYWQWLWLSL